MKHFFYYIKLFFLFAFVTTLGYEYWDPIGLRSSFTLPKLFGLLYAITALTDIKNNFSINKTNKALILSGLALWLWIMFVTLFKSTVYHYDLNLFLGLFQVIILFWLVYNEIDNNNTLKPKIFIAFSLGMFSVSLLLAFGIGLEAADGSDIDNLDNARVYFMGMNPNRMGALASLAVLLIFHLVFSNTFQNKLRYALLLLIPNLLMLIGLSGSRGAFFMVLLGLLILFGFKKTSIFKKVIYIFLGLAIAIFLIDYLSEFDKLQSRLIETYEAGDTGERFKLMGAALQIFENHPFVGVGYNGLAIEMQKISSNSTAHNVFIDFAVMGGLVAFVLFANMIRILFQRSLKFSKLNRDTCNLMILVVIVFILAKSGGGYVSKMSWLMLATIAPVYLIKSNK